jgi:hypothetical protein
MANAALPQGPGSSGPHTGIDLQKNKARAGAHTLIGHCGEVRAVGGIASEIRAEDETSP